MIKTLRSSNLLLAFLLELGMLAAFVVVGWALGGSTPIKAGLAVALPVVAIVLWAIYAAPRAGKRRLKMPALMIFKAVMMGLAVIAWGLAGMPLVSSIFAALAAINFIGMWAFRTYLPSPVRCPGQGPPRRLRRREGPRLRTQFASVGLKARATPLMQ